MKYFSFNVNGWINPQILRAENLDDACKKIAAFSFCRESYGLKEISEDDFKKIVEGWENL